MKNLLCALALTFAFIGTSFAQAKKGECKVVLKAGSSSASKTYKNKSLKACKSYTKQAKKVSGASYGTFNGKKVKTTKAKARKTKPTKGSKQ